MFSEKTFNGFVWRKMTQDELSRKVDVPYTYTTLIKVEIGFIKSPSIFVVAKIAKTLGVTIEDIISNKTN